MATPAAQGLRNSFVCGFCFLTRGFTRSSGWPQTSYVDKASLEILALPSAGNMDECHHASLESLGSKSAAAAGGSDDDDNTRLLERGVAQC